MLGSKEASSKYGFWQELKNDRTPWFIPEGELSRLEKYTVNKEKKKACSTWSKAIAQ